MQTITRRVQTGELCQQVPPPPSLGCGKQKDWAIAPMKSLLFDRTSVSSRYELNLGGTWWNPHAADCVLPSLPCNKSGYDTYTRHTQQRRGVGPTSYCTLEWMCCSESSRMTITKGLQGIRSRPQAGCKASFWAIFGRG